MNTYQKKLMQHCNEILGNPNIRQRIVVLCEGQGSILNLSDETTVNYGKMKQMPDADFYIKCIPKTWKTYKPEFFNCQQIRFLVQSSCEKPFNPLDQLK